MGLDPAPVFRRFDLAPETTLIAAVSGGSDSLALLLLLADFLKSAAPPPRLVAVTVDHRLRPEGAREARTVAALCRSIGIAHRVMVWEGDKPATGLPAAAREARYRLLAQAADDEGAAAILTGHTMDDQAETVAMRRARRGAGAGLAGMARATLYDERLWIARPLLGLRRWALRGHLMRMGVAWVDDPTNDNPLFERARVRARLTDGEVEALAASAQEEGASRRVLAQQAADLGEGRATRPLPGLFRLDPSLFAREHAAGVHLVRVLLATAGGMPYLPDLERTGALFSRLRQGRLRATLSRAVIDARAGGVWIRREARDVTMTAVTPPSMLWDGRWRIGAAEACRGGSIGPLGVAAAAAPAGGGVPESLARAALSLEPGLFVDGRLVGPASEIEARHAGVSAAPVAAPYARFMPDFDMATAGLLRRLLGRPPLPTPPWRNHIDERA